MPISSLVVHLSQDEGPRRAASAALAEHQAFLVGRGEGDLLGVALDTPDEEENKRCWRWLNELPGVDRVEVVNVFFPADETPARAAPRGQAGKPAKPSSTIFSSCTSAAASDSCAVQAKPRPINRPSL